MAVFWVVAPCSLAEQPRRPQLLTVCVFFAGSLENRIEHFAKKHRLEITFSDEESGQEHSVKKHQVEVISSDEGSSQEH
jgi:hypothetical protein